MEYKPVDCRLYDELELLALKKIQVLIRFRDDNFQTITYESVIADLFSKNKIEFLKLDNGKVIRLDNLLEVNGKQFGNSCRI